MSRILICVLFGAESRTANDCLEYDKVRWQSNADILSHRSPSGEREGGTTYYRYQYTADQQKFNNGGSFHGSQGSLSGRPSPAQPPSYQPARYQPRQPPQPRYEKSLSESWLFQCMSFSDCDIIFMIVSNPDQDWHWFALVNRSCNTLFWWTEKSYPKSLNVSRIALELSFGAF